MKRMSPRLLVFLLLALALMSVVVHLQPSAHGGQRGDAILGMCAQVVTLVFFAGVVRWTAAYPGPHDHDLG